MEKIRIGVLGCAAIARRSVIPAIRSLSGMFELTAVASREMNKAAEFAGQFHCRAVEGYDSLVESEDVDALYIPLPTGLHREWILKALRCGKHVYAEKSIAMNPGEARQMVELARKNGLALMEGYMFQYHAQHRKVLELLEAGAIGEIRHFSASFGFPPFADRENFRYDNALGGGALKDAAGYVVRAAQFILRKPLQVQGASVFYDPQTQASLYGSAFLKGEDGLGASLSFGFDNFYQCTYSVWGSRGKLAALKAFTPKEDEAVVLLLETSGETVRTVIAPDNHFVSALKEFRRIVTEEGREKHYEEILLQSETLDEIERQSNE